MPNKNGTGPEGKGAKTGRGKGPCISEAGKKAMEKLRKKRRVVGKSIPPLTDTLEKAIKSWNRADYILWFNKGRGYGAGTERTWGGKTYKKQSDGKWVPVSDGESGGQSAKDADKANANQKSKEEAALAYISEPGNLGSRIKQAMSVMSKDVAEKFKGGTLDVKKRRLVSKDGKHALQWQTRTNPGKPESSENQQTLAGAVVVVNLGDAESDQKDGAKGEKKSEKYNGSLTSKAQATEWAKILASGDSQEEKDAAKYLEAGWERVAARPETAEKMKKMVDKIKNGKGEKKDDAKAGDGSPKNKTTKSDPIKAVQELIKSETDMYLMSGRKFFDGAVVEKGGFAFVKSDGVWVRKER